MRERHMLGKFIGILKREAMVADVGLADSTLGGSWIWRQQSGGVYCTM